MSTPAEQTRELRAKTLGKPKMPEIYPENNPAWYQNLRPGVSNPPQNARGALEAALDAGTMNSSMLDEMVYQMRISGLQPRDIAARLAIPEKDVITRLDALYKRMAETTESEMRMLQVGRLEALINMAYNIAATGSVEHMEILLKAIERLNRMFELESEKTRVEVNFISEQQANLIFATVQMVVEKMAAVCNEALQAAGAGPLGPEIINGTVSEVLDEASGVISQAVTTPVAVERKGGTLVRKNDPR